MSTNLFDPTSSGGAVPPDPSDPQDDDSMECNEMIKKSDPLFLFLAWFPIILGTALVPIGAILWFIERTHSIAGMTSGFGALLLIFGSMCFLGSKQVDPDKVGVRQFISGRMELFHNCRIFAPILFSKTVFIPGGQQIESTATKQDQEGAVLSLVKQTVEVKGKSEERSALQFFVLEAVYAIDVFRNPLLVIRAFYRAFRKAENTDQMLVEVKKQVLRIIIARADELLQTKHMRQIQTDIKSVNGELLTELAPDLQDIGVRLIQMTIAHTEDANETSLRKIGGFLAEMTRKTFAELKSSADQAVAEATKLARIAQQNSDKEALLNAANNDKEVRTKQANANKDASTKEMEARKEIALKQQGALAEELKVKELAELVSLQKLIQTLKAMEGKEIEVVLSKIAAMDEGQLTEFLNTVAEHIGINVQGNLTLLGTDPSKLTGGNAITDLIRTAVTAFRGSVT